MYKEPGSEAKSFGFDNDTPEAVNQLRMLSDLLDGHSTSVLAATGIAAGWHCWEVGAGGGSIARWLAEQVGPDGRVLATDIKPQHITVADNVTVAQHDVRVDPLPRDEVDLIHARLVLMHLSDRDTILRRLITALTPGGVLVVSDFHCDCPSIVEEAPDEDSARLYRRYHEALHALTARAKGDITWATRAAETMRQAALVDVHTYDHGESWTGGSPGCLFHRSNSLQLQDQLVSLGYVTVEELTQVRQLLADPRLVIKSYLTRTSVGRRATA